MSHPEIVERCKKVIIQYLLDAIGQKNIVSIILYGSVARNEESYNYKDGKLYLESDIDVMVVVKNKIVVIQSWLGLKRLCNEISDILRKDWLLSFVNISITTEDRLLNVIPNDFHLHLKLNGKTIYGKELVALMPSYGNAEYRQIPDSQLKWTIFAHMVKVVRSVASSGIIDGTVSVDGYNSILKSIRKLTLFMIRDIIIKDSIPLNPYNISDIKMRRQLYKIKNAELFDDLLKSHDDIKLKDSKEDCSIDEIWTRLVRVINQFNSTIEILTSTKEPFANLQKKIIFGHIPLSQRVQYSIYILVTNFRTGWSIGLFKYIISATFHHEDATLKFHHLFNSSSSMIKSINEEGITNNQRRQDWLKLYKKTFKPWEYLVN
jgi:predicted nucleotidyltransferase